jgi:hypothetical protein
MARALGAHSWQAMAFNPKTGLIYVPAQEIGMIYEAVKDFQTAAIGWNIGTATTFKSDVKGYLIAIGAASSDSASFVSGSGFRQGHPCGLKDWRSVDDYSKRALNRSNYRQAHFPGSVHLTCKPQDGSEWSKDNEGGLYWSRAYGRRYGSQPVKGRA